MWRVSIYQLASLSDTRTRMLTARYFRWRWLARLYGAINCSRSPFGYRFFIVNRVGKLLDENRKINVNIEARGATHDCIIQLPEVMRKATRRRAEIVVKDAIKKWSEKIWNDAHSENGLVDFHDREKQAHQNIAVLIAMLESQ